MSKICLNMIVKDESSIIVDTLTKLINKIKIHNYVICDTGSKDNTPELIKSFFDKNGIDGEIHHHTWKNFGHNRTLALECAKKSTCDYIFIFDADDEIIGDFFLPPLNLDSYMLKFGKETVYERMVLVKNTFSWKFVGVLHEYITANQEITKGTISGNYYINSGRTSSRNANPDKYLLDAKILEEGYHESLKTGDGLHNRYAYYCANSYKDAGKNEEALKWYKITVSLNGWLEEKYNSCLKIYEISNEKDYLVKSYTFNKNRVEGIYSLIKHYTCEGEYEIAWNYYKFIQKTYEKDWGNLSEYLFVNLEIYNFYLPYYMIIVCEKTNHKNTGLKMYEIIFDKKFIPGQWWLNNLIYNLQFFDYTTFISSFKNYTKFLLTNGLSIDKSLLKRYLRETIFIYIGFSDYLWNITYSQTNAIGGSERAVIYLAKEFSKKYNVVISGDVLEEKFGDIEFIHRFNLKPEKYEILIVSRYVSFFTMYPFIESENVILMAHDIHFLNNLSGCKKSVLEIIESNLQKINKVVCLTQWHAEKYIELYPCLSEKIKVINNGIPSSDKNNKIKIPNSFVYTSGSIRGLKRLLELWPEINLPNKTLSIASYESFPKDSFDESLHEIIQRYDNITHLGKLGQTELYNLMEKSEFWLYPCCFEETSCITALEMLRSEVICLYYPIAGLTETIGNYGIKIKEGNEIETIQLLTTEQKEKLKSEGKKYALSCSWENRGLEWMKMFKTVVFYATGHFASEMLSEYICSLNNNIIYTTDLKKVGSYDEIIFVYEIFDYEVFKLNKTISYLNTEPLNIQSRINYVLQLKKHNISYFYDYSLSNIKILNNNGIKNTIHLPYLCNPKENRLLKQIKEKTEIIYDFGIICASGTWTTDVENLKPLRRQQLVKYLLSRGFTVNVITGWDEKRDRELAKCKSILNIHGQYKGEHSTIFEHIRCNRLLYAGYNILSETCEHLESEFVNSFPNLSFKNYNDFFKMKKQKIIDTFIFYNEIEMLRYRLTLLKDIVDTFVIVESRFTFTGKPKQLYFNKSEYSEYNIVHVVVDTLYHNATNEQVWLNEKYQRNCISTGLQKIEIHDDDFIIISDVDEIPDPETLKNIKISSGQFEQDFYYYNMDSMMDHRWYYSKILTYRVYCSLKLSIDDIRNRRFVTIPRGGWHLSYFGTPEFISNKIKNFSHQEYNSTEFTDISLIKERVNSKKDLFNRPISILKPNKEYLPPGVEGLFPPGVEGLFPPEVQSLNTKNYCFIHSCTINHTKHLEHLMEKIKNFDVFEKIFINNIGKPIQNNFEKVELTNYSDDKLLFEIPTINKIKQFSEQNPDCNILYIHTKGVSFPDDYQEEKDWVDMMLYFLLDFSCIKLLETYDTLGCNYDSSPKTHYAGNFWWAKSSYLKTLNLIEGFNKNDAEMWLLSNKNVNCYTLHNSGINHYHTRYPKTNYIKHKVIGFHSCGHLSERGTVVAMFDYAYFNQKLNNNRSIIFYDKSHQCNNKLVIDKFKKEFQVVAYDSFDEINNYNLDYFYNIKGINDNTSLTKFKNLSHIVFVVNDNLNENEIVAPIAPWVKGNKFYKSVPHMINLPIHQENMKAELGIPQDGIVLGRHGGYEEFNISFVYNCIIKSLERNSNLFYIFVNTKPFYNHKNIFYLPIVSDLYTKVKFINTCDAMIHARSEGEVFSMSMGEFSYLNKPIITCKSHDNNGHIELLGEKGIYYTSPESLDSILENLKSYTGLVKDWNAYSDYSPENVMKIFNKVFLNEDVYNDMTASPKIFNVLEPVTIVSAFFDINRSELIANNNHHRKVDDYVSQFLKYPSYYKIILFMDSRYKLNIPGITIIPINISFLENEIYAWKCLNKDREVMNSENYKKLVGHRINQGYIENISPEYNSLMHAKVDFLNYAATNGYVTSGIVCWSDFGIYKIFEENHPTEPLDSLKMNTLKVNVCLRNKIKQKDYNPYYTLQYAPETFTGGFFCLHVNNLPVFTELYHKSLNELYSLGISDDDQHVLLRCYYNSPELFELFLDQTKWPQGLIYFQK